MKISTFLFFPVLLALVFLSSCALTSRYRLERDFKEFRAWTTTQQNQLENSSEESWQQAQEEFKTWTANLDRQVDKLSDELQKEYKQLKGDFEEYVEEQERLRQKEKWRTNLLEDAADTSSITSVSLWQAYATFMSNVRLRHEKWTEQDWKCVHDVYKDLTKRQAEVSKDITTEDQVRIQALQMEYHALRSTAEKEEKEEEQGS